MNNLNDPELIESVLGGDPEAFGVLVGRYSDTVFALVFRIAGNREDAEEIVQDAFVKAYGSLGKFRRDSSFSSWIYRIAYNTAISHLRKNKNVRMTELAEERLRIADEDSPAEREGLFREEQLSRLEEALARLSPDERAVVQLFYLEERPVREISRITGLSENNVKTRLHRIRKRLGAIYENL